jgi:TetR/AcrR family transcriptional regulator, cholesterol catabolism regulator
MTAVAQKDPRPGVLNEARWEEIVAAATEVFGEKGYRAATLQDIASKVGMLKGSLYYYIEGKEDLLFEIIRRGHLRGIRFVQEDEIIVAADPASRLAALIRRWMEGLQLMGPIMQVPEEDFRRYLTEERRNEILGLRKQIAAVPYAIITAGVRDGVFPNVVDPEVVSGTLFRVLNTTLQWFRPDGRVSREELIDWFIRLFLGGLSSDAGIPVGAGIRTAQRGSTIG